MDGLSGNMVAGAAALLLPAPDDGSADPPPVSASDWSIARTRAPAKATRCRAVVVRASEPDGEAPARSDWPGSAAQLATQM